MNASHLNMRRFVSEASRFAARVEHFASGLKRVLLPFYGHAENAPQLLAAVVHNLIRAQKSQRSVQQRSRGGARFAEALEARHQAVEPGDKAIVVGQDLQYHIEKAAGATVHETRMRFGSRRGEAATIGETQVSSHGQRGRSGPMRTRGGRSLGRSRIRISSSDSGRLSFETTPRG